MPRRKRLTRAKKAGKRTGGDPDAPSEAEWEKMQQYGSFVGEFTFMVRIARYVINADTVVRDEDDEDHMFSIGDT